MKNSQRPPLSLRNSLPLYWLPLLGFQSLRRLDSHCDCPTGGQGFGRLRPRRWRRRRRID